MTGGAHSHNHSHGDDFWSATAVGLRALKVGTAGLVATAAAQFVLFAFSGSIALLGDTLHNVVNVAGTVIVWVAFRISGRAPTRRFAFGFHRVEDLATLAVVVLIVASAGLVLFEAARGFVDDAAVRHPLLVIAAGLAGAAGNEAVARYKIRAGNRIGSAALIADGQHSRVDGFTSLGVVAAGVGVLAGANWVDAAVGCVIALAILRLGYFAGRDALFRLLDASDPQLEGELVRVASDLPVIDHVNDLRLRQLGRTVHVVANVCMPPEFTLARAHDAAEALREAWLHVLPAGSAVDIHVDPHAAAAAHHGVERPV